jgi:hypothetical protein
MTEEKKGLSTEKCPKCGSGTMMGFGLMGGGYGPYVMCDGELSQTCDWMHKEQSKDNEPPALDNR